MNDGHSPNAFNPWQIWSSKSFGYLSNFDDETTLFPLNVVDHPPLSKQLFEDLDLPQLEPVYLESPDDVAISDGSVFSVEPEPRILENVIDDTVWRDLYADGDQKSSDRKICSWEAFTQPLFEETCSAYLSEAGPDIFEAALDIHAQQIWGTPRPGTAIEPNILLRSLLALGLGRSSVLFEYHKERKEFEQLVADCRIFSYSLEASQGLVAQVSQCGQNFRSLRSFTEKVYRAASSPPALVAAAHIINARLDMVEKDVGKNSSRVNTYLQLQNVFEHHDTLLTELGSTAEAVAGATSNEEVMSILFRRAQNAEREESAVKGLLRKLFREASAPWLYELGCWIGSHAPAGRTIVMPQYVKIDKEDSLGDYDESEIVFEASGLPDFISKELGREVFELGKNRQLLERHSHVQISSDRHISTQLRSQPEFAFSWRDLERLTQNAIDLERHLCDAVAEERRRDISTPTLPRTVDGNRSRKTLVSAQGSTDDPILSEWDEMIKGIRRPIVHEETAPFDAGTDEDTSDIEVGALDPDTASVPLLSLSPILNAYKTPTDASLLRVLFFDHHLKAHLSLQHSFHLLGDGMFVARLTSALFDPSRATAERRKGVMRNHETMGLRLGERTTWPPASSELQLALMGVMSQCYSESKLSQAFGDDSGNPLVSSERTQLPGSLNFAIRQLPPQEADRCMDPSSLFALDFLRLQYSAPSPVHTVITRSSLDKYDSIFRALLRLQRIMFATTNLPRSGLSRRAMQLRWEMQMFVTICSRHFFDVGVGEHWTAFTAYLDRIEHDLGREDEQGVVGQLVTVGIEDLRAAHEGCLDKTMFALLLRKRQSRVAEILEEVFDLILRFAKVCGSATLSEEGILRIPSSEIEVSHQTFRSKVNDFVGACREQSGRKGYAPMGEDDPTERLLLVLQFNGHFGT